LITLFKKKIRDATNAKLFVELKYLLYTAEKTKANFNHIYRKLTLQKALRLSRPSVCGKILFFTVLQVKL